MLEILSDRSDGGVDLELIRLDLLVAHAAGVGGLDDETLDRVEKVRHLGEVALGRRDDGTRSFRVVDRLIDALHLGAKTFRDDEARGIVGTSVDPKSRREPLQTNREVLVGSPEVVSER